MKTDHLSIVLKYCRNEQTEPVVVALAPNDYFDFEDDDAPDVDSVSKHFNLLDYVKDRDRVTYLSVAITNTMNGKRLEMTTNYYDHQMSTMSTRTEYVGQVLTYREMIIDLLLPKDEKYAAVHDIRRFVLRGCRYQCTFHHIVKTNSDGTQEDEILPTI